MKRRELYVACSRVTKLSGLYFVDGHFEAPKCNKNYYGRKEIENLETNRLIKFDLQFLQDYSEKYHTFIFTNIQSLHKYFNLIKADGCITSAEFIFLEETWSLAKDQYSINDYNCIYRHDCSINRHGFGIMIYAKNHLNNTQIIFTSNEYNNTSTHNIVAFTYHEYCFCVIYNGPGRSLPYFKAILQNMINTLKEKLEPNTKIIVVGDFNIDISKN